MKAKKIFYKKNLMISGMGYGFHFYVSKYSTISRMFRTFRRKHVQMEIENFRENVLDAISMVWYY